MKKRKYTLKERAKQQDETRQRIVQAAMELHKELGPRKASISAIAERAGTQRLTVYRHFEDDAAIFDACSSLWLSLHPLPDLDRWAQIDDAQERQAVGLREIYDYYEETQSMWRNCYQDLAEVPALAKPMGEIADYLKLAKKQLMPTSIERTIKPMIDATLHHALEFSTWQALQDQGLSNTKKVTLVMRWLEGLGG